MIEMVTHLPRATTSSFASGAAALLDLRPARIAERRKHEAVVALVQSGQPFSNPLPAMLAVNTADDHHIVMRTTAVNKCAALASREALRRSRQKMKRQPTPALQR